MKRSSGIKLMLMGTATFMLAACGDDSDANTKPAGVFSSVDECIASGVYTEPYCRTGWQDALQQHQQVAPRYASRADCEADFGPGQCQSGTTANGGGGGVGSFFMPLMMGYMLGQAVEGFRGSSAQPLYRPNQYQGPGAPPGSYKPGSWRTATNVEVAERTGVTRIDPGKVSAPPARTTTIQRGGFGSRAAAVASGGG